MTIVRNTLTEPDGSPLVNRPVSARLASDGFRPLRSEQIASVTSVRTDSTGLYELDLAAQSAIDPAGTHYVITHPDGTLWPIVVPDGEGPFWVRDILVDDPAAPDPITTGLVIVDNGDGSYTLSGAGIVDHGDGSYTLDF